MNQIVSFHEENVNIDGWDVVLKFSSPQNSGTLKNVRRLLYEEGVVSASSAKSCANPQNMR